jgi:hypothetical protein
MRGLGLPGNVCRVVLRLDGGLDAARLRQRVAASPLFDWLPRVSIVRWLPLFPPAWRAAQRPRIVLHEHDCPGTAGAGAGGLPPAVLEREMHAGRGPSIALDLVRYADGTARLVLSWNHALMDARGAELILRHLHGGGADNGAPGVEHLINPEQPKRSLSKWWDNLQLAHGSVEWLDASGREPLFTLLPAAPAAGSRQNLSRVLSFTEKETALIEERCHRLNAGFRRSHFYLAASIRAVHAIATQRGNRDAAYLIPVPHDMRRRGAKGPIFSNHLSILFYRIEASQAARLGDIMAELSRQMMDQIRTKFPECCMAALNLFKPMPLNYYLRHLGKPTRGKFATFSFSDSGETCTGMTDLMGGKIQEVTHHVPTWRPPGLTVLFWNFKGRPSAQLSWVNDCLSPAEADALERGLRSALLEEAL